jgi:hypothetical protein
MAPESFANRGIRSLVKGTFLSEAGMKLVRVQGATGEER